MPREMGATLYYKHDIDNLHAEPRIKLRAIYQFKGYDNHKHD